MDMSVLVIFAVVLFLVIALIQFVFKTLKWTLVIGLILIVFFLVYRGGGDFFGSEDGVSEEVSEEIVCESDEECVFVVSGEGCGFIEGSCNIMGNETCEGALFDESVACGCFEGVCGITQDI